MTKRGRHVSAEAAEILLVATLGRGGDDAVRPRERPDERRAAGTGVDEHKRPSVRLEPVLKFHVGNIVANEVELGRLAVERTVANEQNPNFTVRLFDPFF